MPRLEALDLNKQERALIKIGLEFALGGRLLFCTLQQPSGPRKHLG